MTSALLLPYRPVLGHPVLRRLLPGLATSALGDGLALVAVTWLALQLAPEGQRGTWTALAVAAYTLPGAAGAVLLGRWLGGRSGAQLAGWDATVRAAALGAIPAAHLVGVLDAGLYVVLLAVSSLLHPWGSAGRFTLVAELLPQRHHLAANALLGTLGQAATIVGPPLAGLLIAGVGPVWVIAIDAVSFAVLAVSYRLVIPTTRHAGTARHTGSAGTDRHASNAGTGNRAERPASGFRIIARDRSLLGLLSLSFAFFFLFGPFYVAMPVHVTDDLHASAGTLAAYYAAFGVGSLLGGLLTGHLRGWPPRTTLAGIVALFGTALLPLGLGAPVVLSLSAFALAGLVWAPYQPTVTVLFQRRAGAADLPRVLAANGALLVLSVPLGTMLGGPATALLGARPTLLTCAVAILVLGLLVAGHSGRGGAGRGPGRRPAHPDATGQAASDCSARTAVASAREIGPAGSAATAAPTATATPAKTNAQDTPPAWSMIRPAIEPPAALAATDMVTTQVYASFSMPAGAIRPTSVFSRVSAGAMAAPPSTSATPSAAGPGITAKTAKLAATVPSSQANWRVMLAAGLRTPNQKPPMALPMPQTASSTPARLSGSSAPEFPAKAGTMTPEAPKAMPRLATQSSSAGKPPIRSGPRPRA